MVKVVFFDIDETLVLHRQSSNEALTQMFKDGAPAGQYVHYYHKALKLNPRIKKYLKKYAKCRLGIISDGYSRYQVMKLKSVGLTGNLVELFDPKLCFFSIDLRTKKNKPKIWSHAEKVAQVAPEEILMVGDDSTNDGLQPKMRGWETIII